MLRFSYYRVVELVTGQEGQNTAILEGNLKNLKDTLPWGTKVEMSSEAAVIQLWSSEGRQPEHKDGNWGCKVDQNPRRESRRKSGSNPGRTSEREELLPPRTDDCLENTEEYSVMTPKQEEKAHKDMGSSVKDCYKILLISASEAVTLPAPKINANMDLTRFLMEV